ncbi:MAG: rhamnan synthesis F family protein [Ruthenibacterium sp.]
MNTLAIFYYGNETTVEAYALYILSAMQKVADDLVIVCDAALCEQERTQFQTYTEKIVCIEQSSDNFSAYAAAIEAYRSEWSNSACTVCMSGTLMGPVNEFQPMFSTMQEKKLDYWGVGCNYNAQTKQNELLSDFIVMETKSAGAALLALWQQKDAAVSQSGVPLTLQGGALHGGAYLDTAHEMQFTQTPLMDYPARLIERKQCPVFFKASFTRDYAKTIEYSVGNAPSDLFAALKRTAYPTDMILDYLIHTQNQADFCNNLHLDYILPFDSTTDKADNSALKVALVMHVYFMDLLDDTLQYAKSMPQTADVFITTNTEEKKAQIEEKFAQMPCHHCEVRVIANRGRDVSSILVGVRDVVYHYDYVCFMHDKKSAQYKPWMVGDSFAYMLFENMLGSPAYVQNILRLFEQNPKLGILSPPPPNHSYYFPVLGFEWGDNYASSMELAKKIGLTVPISPDKEPVGPLGTCFWFRPNAFDAFYNIDWKYEDFPPEPNGTDGTLLHAFERMYSFAAQQAGYYPATVASTHYAEIEATNLRYYVRQFNKLCLAQGCNGAGTDMLAFLQWTIETAKAREKHIGFLTQQLTAKELPPTPPCMQREHWYHKLAKHLPKWLKNFLLKIRG